MEATDVLIIGGGPAGAAAAIALGQADCRCIILEKQTSPSWKIGETLPPESRQLLQSLKVWDEFEKAGHLSSPGICSAWGSGELAAKDFIFNPHGCAWQLDRPRFESSLLNAAEAFGAKIFREVSPQNFAREPTGWAIATENNSFRAPWLVDATGRGSVVARHGGMARTAVDKLVAIYALATSPANTDTDARTCLEAAQAGWWYSALLPNHQRIAVFLTDADLLPGQQWRATEWFVTRLRETRFIRELIERHDFRFDHPPQLTSAHSSRLENYHGDGWVAVGDAAQSFDPLSGEGLFHALFTGREAARALLKKISGTEAALADYSTLCDSLWHRFLRNRQNFYLAEARWPTEPFWRRRSTQPYL